MSSPQRFLNGITNVSSDKPFGQALSLDPTLVHVFFEDFDVYTAGDWTVTETQGSATQALADGDGGRLLLTNSAADNDVVALQLGKESFKFESGKKLWFTTKFQISDKTQSDVVIGLHVTDTSPVASAPTDGVFFRKDDGDDNIDFVILASSATVSDTDTTVDIAAATDIRLDFYFDGVDTFHYFVNSVEKGTITTTAFPTTELNVSFCIQNGEAVAKTMNVDWIGAIKER